MPPASPRKSSTSSADRSPPRSRYLGLEAAGPYPAPGSPADWATELRVRLDAVGLAATPFRVIRANGPRAIVEFDHRAVSAIRRGLERIGSDGRGRTLRPFRTWGTLVGAKAWLRGSAGARPVSGG